MGRHAAKADGQRAGTAPAGPSARQPPLRQRPPQAKQAEAEREMARRQIAGQRQQASVDSTADAERRDLLRDHAEKLRALFASRDPDDHARAVEAMKHPGGKGNGGSRGHRLIEREADWLFELQQVWLAVHRESMYAWLLREGQSSAGCIEALALLRASHDRSDDSRARFQAGIARPDAQSFAALVRLLSLGFGGSVAQHRLGYEMLRRQPAALLRRLVEEEADYRQVEQRSDGRSRYDVVVTRDTTLDQFLIEHVERSEFSVRALAVLRGLETDVGKLHVELAAELIPPSGEDARSRVVRTLEDMAQAPDGERSQVESRYDLMFRGVGHRKGSRSPDRLRQHLQALEGWYEISAYHRALALLNHRPTPAEELYFLLPRYARKDVHGAMLKLREFAQANVSRSQLEQDWDRYVSSAQPGNAAPFTPLPLRAHIASVLRTPVGIGGLTLFTWGDKSAERQFLLLYNALNLDELDHHSASLDEASRKLAAPKPAAGGEHDPAAAERRQVASRALGIGAEEARLRHAENVRLSAAEAMLDIHVNASDSERIAALKEISGILNARVERDIVRREAIRDELSLPHGARRKLIDGLDQSIAQSRFESERARRKLVGRVDRDELRLSNTSAPLARLALVDKASVADEIYALVIQREYARVTDLVTRCWAGGGINRLIKDAAMPVNDAVAGVYRPPYRFSDLALHVSRSNFGKQDLNSLQRVGDAVSEAIDTHALIGLGRVFALTASPRTDVERGALALNSMIALGAGAPTGQSAAGLGEVLKFLQTPGLGASQRSAVISTYFDLFLHKPAAGEAARADAAADRSEIFLAAVVLHYEGLSENALALRELLKPPQSDRERAQSAAELSRLGADSVTEGFADWWEARWGTHRRAAAARSNDWLQYIAQATPAELARMRQESGLRKPEDIGAYYHAQYRERRAVLRALEDAVVDRMADLVELAVEAGVTLVTGGAALAAVIGAMAAACASIVVHEVAQRENYTLGSWDNVNAVLQAGIGALAVEGGLREKVVKLIELKALGEAAGGLGRHVQETVQNVVTGMIESAMSSAVELSMTALTRSAGVSDEDIAKQKDLMLGKIFGKVLGTRLTVHFHPGLHHVQQAITPRYFIQLLFKTGLRLESISKEAVKLWYSSKADQPFLDSLVDIALKVGFGELKSAGKAAASAAAGARNAKAEQAFVARYAEKHPEAFAATVLKSVAGSFHGVEGEKLKKQIAARRVGTPGLSDEQAVLDELRENPTFAQRVHKDVKKAAEAAVGDNKAEKLRQGLFANVDGAVPLPMLIDRPQPGPPPPAEHAMGEARVAKSGTIGDPGQPRMWQQMRFKAPPTVALDAQFLREQFRAHPLPLPALPAGYARDVQAFGREIGWGSTQAESLNNMTRIDVRRLRALGLDAGMARQLRDYCLAEDQRDRQIRAAETPQHWGTTFRMLEERQRARQAEDARVVQVGGRPATTPRPTQGPAPGPASGPATLGPPTLDQPPAIVRPTQGPATLDAPAAGPPTIDAPAPTAAAAPTAEAPTNWRWQAVYLSRVADLLARTESTGARP